MRGTTKEETVEITLALAALKVVGYGLACDLVDAFLGAAFEGGRHQTRVDMITAIEEEERK